MIRKHFRIKRLVLGLAAAAILAPAAQAHVYLPSSDLGQIDQSSRQTTITPLQADGMRWKAMANFYKQQQSVGPTARGIQADGLRYKAMADFYKNSRPGITAAGTAIANQKHNAYSVPVSATNSVGSDGFSWSDAGIGASAVFAGLLVLLTVLGLGRRYRTRGLASA